MIDIVILREDWTGPRQFVTPHRELSIGRGDACDVRLADDAVEDHHAQVGGVGERLYVMAHGPIAISGVPVSVRMAGLRPDDTLEVGRYRLRFRARHAEAASPEGYRARDDREAGLLAAVVRGEPGATAVYADWLDQHGEPARAELLRIQDAADALGDAEPGEDPAHRAALAGRLRALAAEVDVAWRMVVSSAGVEACAQFELRCPMQWSVLAPTDRPEVRHCAACGQGVHFARSVGEARAHAAAGRCVALDVLAARWTDDLAPPYTSRPCPRCRAELGAVSPETPCPECDYEQPTMRLGRYVVPRFQTDQICV